MEKDTLRRYQAKGKNGKDLTGVYYRWGTHKGTGKPERIFYISFYRNGERIEEKAGREKADHMTAAAANAMRGRKIDGEPSRKEVREKKAEAKKAEAGRYTIGKLWEAYKEQNKEKPSMKDDSGRYEHYIGPAFGNKLPAEIVPLDVDRLKREILKSEDLRCTATDEETGKRMTQRTGKTAGSVKNVLELLRRLINFGMKKQLADGPGFKIELPKVNNQRTESLTTEQAASLLAVLADWPDVQAANMVRLALFTGQRRGELFTLEWRDVDFERGFITIREPKGGVDQTIPLNPMARAVLESHPRPEFKNLEDKKSPFIFPGRSGGKRQDAKKAVRGIYEAAGIPSGFRPFHGLRHAFASGLASSGQVDLYTLQRLMTHKSPMMTQRYAHLSDEAMKRASAVTGAVFGAVEKKEAEQAETA